MGGLRYGIHGCGSLQFLFAKQRLVNVLKIDAFLLEQLNEGFAGVDTLQVLIRELPSLIGDAAGRLPALAVALGERP